MTRTDRTTRREREALALSLLFLLCAILFSGTQSWLLRYCFGLTSASRAAACLAWC